jgi:hypothetical protein
MDAIALIQPGSTTSAAENRAASIATNAASQGNGFADLGSEDFFKLLITQVTTQDPFEPTGNEELLKQIASIRDIELSTQLADSLRTLTGQQNIGSASGLIGQHVTSIPSDDGVTVSGLVVGVRFNESGGPTLLLSNGAELPLAQVGAVQPPLRAAEALVGSLVRGLDRSDPKNVHEAEGMVVSARQESNGEVIIELDSGSALRFRDVMSVGSA